MDILCDALMLEDLLPRMSPKSLIRLGAASRRYNALVLDPDFSARYWRRAGVFFQPLRTIFPTPELRPLFLSSSSRAPAAAESMFGADLTFLPAPSTREKAYLRHVGDSDCAGEGVAVVVHSAAGLLLCSRGRVHPVHYYVCNPVSGQWTSLPELPCPSTNEWQSGLLRVHNDGDDEAKNKPKRFQVVLFNHPVHWRKPGGCFDLRSFSSETGQWKIVRLQPPIPGSADRFSDWSPIGQSGTAHWISGIEGDEQAIVYNSDDHSVEVIPLPWCSGNGKHCCIGERNGGGLRYAISNNLVFEVWDSQTKGGDRGKWKLAHRVGVVQLLEQIPEAADFLDYTTQWTSLKLTPLGFHPTDDDVVFAGISGASKAAVAAYSIENGTMSLHRLTHECMLRSRDMFPYVHPPYLVQIPAIKNSVPASQE